MFVFRKYSNFLLVLKVEKKTNINKRMIYFRKK